MTPGQAETARCGYMAQLSSSTQSLLDWFEQNHRRLPWRSSQDPYGTWVSEVMLQQTGVAVVVPYFERFMARFPSVAALAAAEPDEVLGLWSGLGYYRRARHLHAAARQIMASGGRFPDAVDRRPDRGQCRRQGQPLDDQLQGRPGGNRRRGHLA